MDRQTVRINVLAVFILLPIHNKLNLIFKQVKAGLFLGRPIRYFCTIVAVLFALWALLALLYKLF